MRLRGQVVNLVRLHLLNNANQTGGIGHIAVMQDKTRILFMRILIQVIDTVGIKQGRAPLDTMHLITLVQQKLGQIGTILPRNAGNQCHFTHLTLP